MPRTVKRKIVKGIEHGLGGYTNYRCKCEICTEANAEHSREYRARRFAGSPLCVVKKCPHPQSHSYGNGLCYKHARQVIALRGELEAMNRMQLKRLIKRHGLRVQVLRGHSDDVLRQNIEDHLGPKGMARLAEAA